MRLNLRGITVLSILLVSGGGGLVLSYHAIRGIPARWSYGNVLSTPGFMLDAPIEAEGIQKQMRVLPGGRSACPTGVSVDGRVTEFLIQMLEVRTSLELHDVHAWLQLTRVPVKSDGAREDPNWSPLKYIGDVSDASQIEVVWNRSLPLRIAGSSTKNGNINVVFGLGDAADPQLAFPTSTSGVIQGSIFHFAAAGAAPTVVGRFKACVTSS